MTNAELAVLSLLVEQPRHGYELEQVIAERGMRDWTDIGFSSIYYVLRRLQDAGLVTAAAEEGSGRGPSRKVFSPTPEGRTAWTEAALAALTTPAGGDQPFLLGLSALAGLPLDRAAAAVGAYADELGRRVADLRGRREQLGDAEWFVDAVFDYSFTMMDAERAWAARYAREMQRRVEGEVGAVPPKRKPFVPEVVEMPARTMAAVRTIGDPTDVGQHVFPALYGAVYPLKFALKKQGVDFKVEPPRARWFGGPDWATLPREEWKAAWAIPVPEDTTELPQKDPATPVAVETWEYGTVAQILHVGTYAEETPTIEQLHAFIAEQGYEIVGPHEEEYLSRPEAKAPKTIIRYQVKKAT
jgi:DNA-binding PadR family transcriptional regulator